jgi:hypothetical protein
MRNSGHIVKCRSQVPYAQIPNDFLQDKTISLRAKGLLSFLLSLPDSWVINKSKLHHYLPEGKDAISNAWDELVKLGYILSVQKIDASGKFTGYDNIVYFSPQLGKPTEPTVAGFSDNGEPATINKEDNKETTIYIPPKPEKPEKPKVKSPTVEEVKAFFEENGYRVDIAVKAWEYYDIADWVDSNGKQVKNWKQKMKGVWFEPENLKPKEKVKIDTTPDDWEEKAQKIYKALWTAGNKEDWSHLDEKELDWVWRFQRMGKMNYHYPPNQKLVEYRKYTTEAQLNK